MNPQQAAQIRTTLFETFSEQNLAEQAQHYATTKFILEAWLDQLGQ